MCYCKEEYATAELGRPPAGGPTPGVGTLAGELCQRAADAEVIGDIATAAHVLYTGLDVWSRVHQGSTVTPGCRVDHLVTDWALRGVGQKVCRLKKKIMRHFFLDPSLGKARQGNCIYNALFIHKADSKCFT